MKSESGMPTIGVTGITGSGTSTVAAILAERGGFVIHADKLAHEAMAKSGPAYDEILKEFGDEILNEKGEINRRVLGERVFSDKGEREKLEKIIHPRVIARTREIVEITPTGHTFAVIDAPLLIESNMHTMCDSVWLVSASDEKRIERITARDAIDEAAAKRRLQSRAGDDTLRPHANVFIENNGSAIALRSRVEIALKALSHRRCGWVGMAALEV
ncbi:MAG: dephospho-CoA kinase [Defluviitaleaceae bacterium]|nr:dephospho-CoA kinase [Defluviitaleaceae bacterium]